MHRDVGQPAVFEGSVGLVPAGKEKKEGFAAVKSAALAEPLDLSRFDALEVRLRSSGGVCLWNVNLVCAGLTTGLDRCGGRLPAPGVCAGRPVD